MQFSFLRSVQFICISDVGFARKDIVEQIHKCRETINYSSVFLNFVTINYHKFEALCSYMHMAKHAGVTALE